MARCRKEEFWFTAKCDERASPQDADGWVIYKSANGNLFFDADRTGGQAQVLIATLTDARRLSQAISW